MYISKNAFDIYLCDDIPYIRYDGMVSKPVRCGRPCPNWVEPVSDEYIVFPVVNTVPLRPIGVGDVSVYPDIDGVIYKQGGTVVYDNLLLESEAERLVVDYDYFQRSIKLGILPVQKLIGVNCEQGIRLTPSRHFWASAELDWGSIIVRDGFIWRDGIMARLSDISYLFVDSDGHLVVSSATCKHNVSKNLFLRRLL